MAAWNVIATEAVVDAILSHVPHVLDLASSD
jgi:hypothetical protein